MGRVGLVFAAASALVAGCYDWRADVRRTAAFEHACEAERVEILAELDHDYQRSARLDVCGRERLYRLTASGWLDVTATVGGDIGGEVEPVVAAEAAPPPPPAWSSEAVLGVLRQIHDPILACTGGAELQIWATLDRSGLLTNVSGIDDLSADVRACVLDAVGRAAAPGDGSPRRVTMRIAPGATGTTGTTADVTRDTAPTGSAPSEEPIRGRLDEVTTRVLACLGTESIVVEVTWSAGDDAAHPSFRGVTDTDAIACAEAAVGRLDLTPPASASGRLIHALAR